MASETANVFERMLGRWLAKGWVRGKYTATTGEVCSIQCLHDVGGGSQDEKTFLQAANELFPRSGGLRWTDIPEFNDKEGRTASDCYRVARRAAEIRNNSATAW